MTFIADLHIHSRFSRATARNLDPENIYMAARKKGITVVGTGDFTHPGWLAELREKLIPAEPGLFRLKDDLAAACEAQLTLPAQRPVRFMLSAEISNIYKKHGATRKLHHLVFLSGFSDVEKFNARLSGIGNLKSDGRPILGLDSRNLLEIALETAPDAFLIPAHIWTPWFSLYGSRSGFDSIKECFDDLSGHIFAAETGLSSDPPMNWRVKDLDGITLVSNSDAHSPANLGREANLFDTELSYDAMFHAMQSGDPEKFKGTIEFFPEEGKYHQDGHRKCNVNFHPRQTRAESSICPVCGHELTLGVLHRVEALAGRPEGEKPAWTHPFYSLIPLAEILSELLHVGPKTKKVLAAYEKSIQMIGPELDILLHSPKDALADTGIMLLDEAVSRMREGRVYRKPGYDGEYGRVTVFTPEERERLIGQKNLFFTGEEKTPAIAPVFPLKKNPLKRKKAPQNNACLKNTAEGEIHPPNDADTITAGLNDAQKKAVTHPSGPMIIVAGPGTGKTRTLTSRIACLLKNDIASADNTLAVTFTNKAAREMGERLKKMLGENTRLPRVSTFHALCFSILKDIEDAHDHSIADDMDRRNLIREAVRQAGGGKKREAKTDTFARCIALAKQKLLLPEDNLGEVSDGLDPKTLSAVYRAYRDLLSAANQYDYDDLVSKTVMHLRASPRIQQRYRDLFSHVFIDEYQDLNYAQYCLVRLLVPENGNICVIGDPDQSIYGFAGADAAFFQRFIDDYPAAAVIRLDQNYRSTETILHAADRIISPYSIDAARRRIYSGMEGTGRPEETRINLLKAGTDAQEAVLIGKMIEQMIGGLGFSYHDFTENAARHKAGASFSDFAVLYRTRAQGNILEETFARAGIPCQRADKLTFTGLPGIREILCALKVMEGWGSYPDVARLIKWTLPNFDPGDLSALMSWGYENGYMVNGLLAEAHRLDVAGISTRGRIQINEFLSRLAGISSRISAFSAKGKLEGIIENFFPGVSDSDIKYDDAISWLKQTADACGSNTAAFLETVALQTDPDFAAPQAEKVSLMTMHTAKGLEFPVVFITGCEEGLIPFRRRDKKTDFAEERRLFYVALTRAENILFLSLAESRNAYGKPEDRSPSPYLSEITDMVKESPPDESFRPKAKQVQLTLFS
ncbi:MAG: UvrD-helicase domain-containing protein [Desulfosalsimonadaceae bacterium]